MGNVFGTIQYSTTPAMALRGRFEMKSISNHAHAHLEKK